MKLKVETISMASGSFAAGFTLIELLVAMALMAVIIPIAVEGLRIATLAGEVSQRKELAARIADKVLNEAIVSGQNQFSSSGDEQSAGYQFHWTMKNQPWDQLSGLATMSNPTGVNQGVVNQNLIHEVSVDVTFAAQGRSFGVHLGTLVNTSQQ
jgi:type II secretion system protein I